MNVNKKITTASESVTISYAHGEADFNDLVHVVRCKDCKNYRLYRPVSSDDKSHHFCRAHDRYMFVDDYCSYGERKDG